jgi:hypothetical protein
MSANGFEAQPYNVLNFYVWGHLHPVGYSPPAVDEETLHQRNFYACESFRTFAGTFERVRQSVIRRIHAYADSSGGDFEHIL